jgi:hypothetical protein
MRRLIQVGVGGYGRTWLDTLARVRERVEHADKKREDPSPAAQDCKKGKRSELPAQYLRRTAEGRVDPVAGQLGDGE